MALVSVSKACLGLVAKEGAVKVDGKLVKLKCLERTLALHGDSRNYFKMDVILASTLVDAYTRSGSLMDARRVFDQMCSHDVMSWTSLVQACVDCREEDKALELFQRMQCEGQCAHAFEHCHSRTQGLHPRRCKGRGHSGGWKGCQSFVTGERDCYPLPGIQTPSTLGLRFGQQDVRQVWESGGRPASFRQHATPWCSLVDSAHVRGSSSVGSLEVTKAIAGEVYRYGAEKDVVLSNSMVDVRQGDAEKVLDVFHRAVDNEGVEPDSVTLLCVLAACSHAGMVTRGRKYFEAIRTMESECAHLEDTPGCLPDVERCGDRKGGVQSLVKIDDRDTAAYSLMSNLLGSVGLWDEQSRLLRSQEELFAQQQAVASYIDCGGLVKE
ncbi:pentatricopeptide repeat-containing protein At4g37170-like [Selaginella moellendorffii]|uniref:pentatricopeptide repeat-containing protein At4g37170-like n=1 Tax=Selaginella moellendorffii TaxID=88036 RepID=UPI000D1C81C7|nr:pentatricopeptide repeat-containing protein At4g37170-like [Selaginella moellendorffii]|eukprot:XP_024521578.1 pentatricopeptide repeat-containing protein At4g37170-like [Selaginella moellendorffii]